MGCQGGVETPPGKLNSLWSQECSLPPNSKYHLELNTPLEGHGP